MSPKTPVKIILGTHQIGDSIKGAGIIHFDAEEDVRAVLDAFYERGYRELDTASNYISSEERLGQVGAPARFTIHTKVHSGEPGEHEPFKVAQSINKSLEDLQTSSVETMFLHVPDRQTPFEDAARAINDAFKEGKFKRFGLSNYTEAEVQQFLDICEDKGYVKPSVYQGHYNPVVRGGEKELFPLLRKHNMSFFAFSPAAGGFFSAHAASSSRWNNDNMVGKLYGGFYGDPAVKASVATVQQAASKHGISGHAAAIRWTAFHSVLDGEYGDSIVFGMSKIEQLHHTLDQLEAGPLPADLADALSALYATVEGHAPPYHL